MTDQQKSVSDLVAALTRAETGKLVSVLARIFGAHNLVMAEDAVQDVFIKAIESWNENGIPVNPAAWLFTAARNKAIDSIRKYRRQKTFAADIGVLLESEYTAAATLNECFQDHEIQDDQLRMMFACCHPLIPREGQIALILKTICGFSVPQIARAFIIVPGTIEKRLYRARTAFREKNITLEIPVAAALESRLDGVLETIYLLFNEAHSASFHDSLTRRDLAEDAIRLLCMLTGNPVTNLPRTSALLALLYFHSSRMHCRTDQHGDLLLMKDQPRELWDMQMIQQGVDSLVKSASGEVMSRYHLEAAIAYEHCKAARYEDTDWKTILSYYDMLANLVPSQVVLLNRAIAIRELSGPAAALAAIIAIPGIDYLNEYYLLHSILGELHLEMEHIAEAEKHFSKALALAFSDAEKKLLAKKLAQLLSAPGDRS